MSTLSSGLYSNRLDDNSIMMLPRGKGGKGQRAEGGLHALALCGLHTACSPPSLPPPPSLSPAPHSYITSKAPNMGIKTSNSSTLQAFVNMFGPVQKIPLEEGSSGDALHLLPPPFWPFCLYPIAIFFCIGTG